VKNLKILLICLCVLLFAAQDSAKAVTVEDIIEIADSFYEGKMSAANALQALRAEAENPDNSEDTRHASFLNMASLNLSIGNLSQARLDVQQALSVGERFAGAYRTLALIEAREHNFEAAIESIEKAIANLKEQYEPDPERLQILESMHKAYIALERAHLYSAGIP
jgi:lipoprotein NlpI